MNRFNNFLTKYVTLPATILGSTIGSAFSSSSSDINRKADDIFLNSKNNIETVIDAPAAQQDTVMADYNQLPEIVANQGKALSGFVVNKDYKEDGRIPFRYNGNSINLSDIVRYSPSNNLPDGLSNSDFSFNIIPLTKGVGFDGKNLTVPENYNGDVLVDLIIRNDGKSVVGVPDYPRTGCSDHKSKGEVVKSLKVAFVYDGSKQQPEAKGGQSGETVMVPADTLRNILEKYDGRLGEISDNIAKLSEKDGCRDSVLNVLETGYTNIDSSLNQINGSIAQIAAALEKDGGHFYVGFMGNDLKGIGGVIGYQANNDNVSPFVEAEFVGNEKLGRTSRETVYNGFGSEDRVDTKTKIAQTRGGINGGLDIKLADLGNLSFHARHSIGAQYISGNSTSTTENPQIDGFEGFEDQIPQQPSVFTEKYSGVAGKGAIAVSGKYKGAELELSFNKLTNNPYNNMNNNSNSVIKQSGFLKNNNYLQAKLSYHFGGKR